MNKLKMIWWNVQRLFSPSPSSISLSLGVTANNGWTKKAYDAKVNAVASVLNAISGGSTPAILGLAEVENRQVVNDIIRKLKWTDLIEPVDNTPWIVGTDVTLLYNKAEFSLVSTPTSHNVHNLYATRDIFEVHLRHKNGQEITFLSHHWPSRRISNSEPLRIGLSDHCKRIINQNLKIPYAKFLNNDGSIKSPSYSTLLRQWNHPVIIMGDFNDEPFNVSTSKYLEATRSKRKVQSKPRLPKKSNLKSISSYMSLTPRIFNPAWPLLSNNNGPAGTTYWGGDWYLLDHIMISRGLLDNNSKIQYDENSLKIFSQKKIPNISGDSDIKMLTRSGYPSSFNSKNHKGISDHLPIVWECVAK